MIIEPPQIQLAALHRQKFGRKSEKCDEQIAQLELKLEEFQTDEAEDPAPATEAVKAARAKFARKPLPDRHTRQTTGRPTQCASIMDGAFAGPLDTEVKRSNRKGRPNYPIEFKRRLAAPACAAGISVSKLAMANAVNANILFKWRRELRVGLFDNAPRAMTKLLRVVLAAAPAEAKSDASSAPQSPGTGLVAIDIFIADAFVGIHGSSDAVMVTTTFQSLRTWWGCRRAHAPGSLPVCPTCELAFARFWVNWQMMLAPPSRLHDRIG